MVLLERSINERFSQTLSRINVLEAQISCLRAEQTQLTRSLDKERQRAAKNRQEYLALKEKAETNEGRVTQLEEEIKDLRRKHKQELQAASSNQELLRQSTHRWNTSLIGDRERQEKFNKLMGGKGDVKTENKLDINDAKKQRKLQIDLEKQYTAGLCRREQFFQVDTEIWDLGDSFLTKKTEKSLFI